MANTLQALGTFIALDFETTGLHAEHDTIIDIGAIRYENGIEAERFSTLVNPGISVSPEITQLTGITNTMLSTAPSLDDILASFKTFVGDFPIVAHNADFERQFLRKIFGEEYTPVYLDTYRLLLAVFPLAESHSLEYFIRKYNIREHELHRGMSDVEDMMAVLSEVDKALNQPEFARLCSIVEHYSPLGSFGGWEWAPFFAGRHQTIAIELRNFRMQYPGEGVCIEPLDESLSYAPQLLKDPTSIKKVFPEYKMRDAQQKFAERASVTLTAGGRYVVEAGTGTGKTLAYASAALAALAEDTSSPVVVSTHTKALQDQFINVEIPRLKKLFETPELRAISLKGMQNYVCLKKLEGLNMFGGGMGSMFAQHHPFPAIFMHHWALLTVEGERDELPYIVLEDPVVKAVAPELRADIRDCEREACPLHEQCFFYKKRWEATQAHIIAINHSLLMSYPKSYPAFTRLIVDEADELYDEAVSAFSITAGYTEVLEIIEALFGNNGALAGLKDIHNTDIMPIRNNLRERWAEVDAALRSTAQPELFITHIQLQNITEEQRLRIVAALDNYRIAAAVAVTAVNDTVKALEKQKDTLSETDKHYRNLLLGFAESFDTTVKAIALFLEQETIRYALYAGVTADSWSITAAPYNIQERFSGDILANITGAVFTSATLSTKPDHSDFISALGIDKEYSDILRDSFRSPFNYRRQSKIIFLKGFTTSRIPQFPEHAARLIAEIAEYLGGRTLGLFTSRDRLTQTHAALISILAPKGYTIITHGITAGSLQKAVEQFKRTDKAVLLGARGLWKGVDIPGKDLQCVVIEKMPYSVPNPYTAGLQQLIIEEMKEEAINRGEALDERRLSTTAWNIVEKPRMFQAFRQMFGRVIRTEHDYGAMVVLDPQLQSSQLSPRHKDLLTLLGNVPYSLTFPDRLIQELSFIKEQG